MKLMKAVDVINKYINFFESNGHARIPNSPIVPENDPTTLFTSSGMQPLVSFLLGEQHPAGKRLANVQNCFRAQDLDEIGDERHTTFFRMMGNWSLGDYFKREQIQWIWEFLTKELNIPSEKLYVTVFEGFDDIPKDTESENVWREIFKRENLDEDSRIFYYGVEKNWWSRAGTPDKMPIGEPGGPDTEIFYDFGPELNIHEKSQFKNQSCHPNCDCGRYWEIANSVFMQYRKTENGFELLPQQNVDFGGGVERLVAVTEGKHDVFENSLFEPIIKSIENTTGKEYSKNSSQMRIIADHLISSVFIAASGVRPSNKERGYILRRLLRRAFDNFESLEGDTTVPIIEKIVDQYRETDEYLVDKFESIKNVILEEEGSYRRTLNDAKKFIHKKYKAIGDELKGVYEISADDAFLLYATHGLSPTQIKSLGFIFDDQAYAEKMKEHRNLSRMSAGVKFAGGLADHSAQTIKGHTATHLLHQALRDVLGNSVHQTGSNITSDRIRFDFSYDKKLTSEEIKNVESIVNSKIQENLPVSFKIMPIVQAKELGAIGLFDEKYQKDVKVYFIGGPSTGSGQLNTDKPYSIEFCGGPHADFTGKLTSFRIIKEESLGKNNRRIYARSE